MGRVLGRDPDEFWWQMAGGSSDPDKVIGLEEYIRTQEPLYTAGRTFPEALKHLRAAYTSLDVTLAYERQTQRQRSSGRPSTAGMSPRLRRLSTPHGMPGSHDELDAGFVADRDLRRHSETPDAMSASAFTAAAARLGVTLRPNLIHMRRFSELQDFSPSNGAMNGSMPRMRATVR